MKNFGITAHCLIRNEERWIWYAIQSVIDYVDQILIFDTGSTDRTVDVIKTIKSTKITFEEKGVVDKKKFTYLRQEMLDRTSTSWFMMLDGDEIWPREAIVELMKTIKQVPQRIEAVVVEQWVCQGDVFHYSKEVEELQEDKTGRPGFWLPRAWRKTHGLHAIGEYGVESFADYQGINASYWDPQRLRYLTHKFFHMSFLLRSSSFKKDREVIMRSYKTRFYKGVPFSKDIKYPEVFYAKRPDFVPNPWRKFTLIDWLIGIFYRSENLLERILNKI